MKRFILAFIAFILIFLSACVADVDSVYPDTSVSEAGTESVFSEAESANESLDASSETEESRAPYLDLTLDLLPLLCNSSDPDEQDKVNDFLNFVLEYYSYNSEPLSDIYKHILENGYSDDIWMQYTGNSIHVWRSLYLREDKTENNVRFISAGSVGNTKQTVITFGGDVSIAENYVTVPYLQNRKDGVLNRCISQQWLDFMNKADIATVNCENPISLRGTPTPHKTYTYYSDPKNTKYFNEMGVDFVTLANNHIHDYGRDAFFDTFDTLDEYGINYAGAGKDASEAQKPFYYIINGIKIAFVSASRAEHRKTPIATEEQAGIFGCYEPDELLSVISETEKNADFTVLFIHWGREYYHTLDRAQKDTAYRYIDEGADLIIGTHAHVLQGIEHYKGKAIFYNLGNFWFNAKHIETGQAMLSLAPDLSTDYYFYPAMQSGCKVSWELGTAQGRSILDNLESYERSNIEIEDDGHIIFKSTEKEQ